MQVPLDAYLTKDQNLLLLLSLRSLSCVFRCVVGRGAGQTRHIEIGRAELRDPEDVRVVSDIAGR